MPVPLGIAYLSKFSTLVASAAKGHMPVSAKLGCRKNSEKTDTPLHHPYEEGTAVGS
jgi:hypothetical protein